MSFVASDIEDHLQDRIKALELLAGSIDQQALGNRAAAQSLLANQVVLQSLFSGGVLIANADGIVIAEAPLERGHTLQPLSTPGEIPAIDRFVDGYEGTQVYVNQFGEEVMNSVKRLVGGGLGCVGVALFMGERDPECGTQASRRRDVSGQAGRSQCSSLHGKNGEFHSAIDAATVAPPVKYCRRFLTARDSLCTIVQLSVFFSVASF
ncbi:MAG: hypothetical protein Q7V56_14395 [Gammaproteobacteria bacterium]|nr:hypothetical protein [Gammaproteobacteria bacterium]